MSWPNLLSAIRLFISPLVFFLILHDRFTAALLWFAFASLTDMLDGEIARRFGLSSYFGEWLDPIADKVLTLFSLSALLMRGYCPAWFVALMVTLSVFQLCGAVLIRTFRPMAVFRFHSTTLGKVGTTLLRIWIALMIFQLTPGPLIASLMDSRESGLSTFIWGSLAGLHVAVFFQYFYRVAGQLLPLTALRR